MMKLRFLLHRCLCLVSIDNETGPGGKAKCLLVTLALSSLFLIATFVFADSGLISNDNIVKVVALSKVTKKGNIEWGYGTGFVINDDGYIVTNNHVAGGKLALFVIKNGQRVNLIEGLDFRNKYRNTNIEARPWASVDLDLAILKVKPEYLHQLNLKPVTLSSQIPGQSKTVSAVGYPGIADQTTAKTKDVTANSTYSKGEVARIIEDGYWRKGGQSIVQLLHTVPISGGNSGGPLFDECGRVIGVNTAAPTERSKVFNDRGKQIAEGVVANAAYGLASSVNELIAVLDSQGIDYYTDNSVCLSKQEIYEEKNERLSRILQLTLYIGAAAFTAIGLLLVYVLRNPASRKKVGHVVESYSRSIRRPGKVRGKSHPEGSNKNTRKIEGEQGKQFAGSAPSLILDGYGPKHKRYRVVIDAHLLFQGECIVGREPGNIDYAVREDSVSRDHCSFWGQGNELFLKDLHSTNGTFVNSRKVLAGESVSLSNGDEIKLGAVVFKVIAG